VSAGSNTFEADTQQLGDDGITTATGTYNLTLLGSKAFRSLDIVVSASAECSPCNGDINILTMDALLSVNGRDIVGVGNLPQAFFDASDFGQFFLSGTETFRVSGLVPGVPETGILTLTYATQVGEAVFTTQADASFAVQPVPEPATIALLATTALALRLSRRRRRDSAFVRGAP
jgi:hypothetical protein